MTPNNSIDITSSRQSVYDSRRSSIDLSSHEIISSFFVESSNIAPLKWRLLNDFRFKVMADSAIQNPQIDRQIENYFSAVEKFENVDQEFLKEMLFNGYKPSENLIKIFKEKNFEFNKLTISRFENNSRIEQTIDIKLENYVDNAILKPQELSYQQTLQFKDSIIDGLAGLEQDKIDDTSYYKIILIKFGDQDLPLKLVGLSEFLKNPNLTISPIEGSKIKPSEDLNLYDDWNIILRNIAKEINKNKFVANGIIRISQDNSGSHNMDYNSIINYQNEEDKKIKTSCCYGIIKSCQDFFSKFLNKPTQSPSLNQRHLINLSSSSNSNNSSVLLD
jgi:hypothetical protein